MKIGRIAHSGWMVSFEGTRCLIDPLFQNVFSGGCERLDPPIRVWLGEFRSQRWDAVILTHAHPDHFSLETLILLDRKTPIYIPDGDLVMERCLRDLGFTSVISIAPRQHFSVRKIRFTATPSAVPFSEMGILIRVGNRSCWNMADSIVTPSTLRFVEKTVGRRLDFVLFPFQPLIESPLGIEVAGRKFPTYMYEYLLKTASKVNARYLAPSACGFRSSVDWVNSKMFPVTEERFASDLFKYNSAIQTQILHPGDEAEFRENRIFFRAGKIKFVRAGRPFGKKWIPDQVVPRLEDPNFQNYQLPELGRNVMNFLQVDFPRRLDPTLFRKKKTIWQLELVFPGGKRRILHTDFSRKNFSWKPGKNSRAQVTTTAAASAVLAVIQGEMDQGGVMHTGLIRNEFADKSVDRDPLTSVIYRMAHERALMKRLEKILKNC